MENLIFWAVYYRENHLYSLKERHGVLGEKVTTKNLVLLQD